MCEYIIVFQHFEPLIIN